MVDDCRHAEILLEYGSIAAYLDSVLGSSFVTNITLEGEFNRKLTETVKAHEVARMWQPKGEEYEAAGHDRSEIRYEEWLEARADNRDAIIQAIAVDLMNERLDGDPFFIIPLIEWVAVRLDGLN